MFPPPGNSIRETAGRIGETSESGGFQPFGGAGEDDLNCDRGDDQPGNADQRPDQVQETQQPADRQRKQHEDEVQRQRQREGRDAGRVTVFGGE